MKNYTIEELREKRSNLILRKKIIEDLLTEIEVAIKFWEKENE